MEWKEITLGEIAIFKTGKLNSNAAISNGEYPFFTCSPETLRINNYAFDQEAILLAGNNADGNFSIKYYKGKFNAYQRTYVITPIRGKVDIKFLYYALSLCLKQFKNMSQGTSTKFLTVTILNSFSVQLPSISDQHRIASILSSLDRKIELNNKINADLEEMAQAIFKNWFVDFEPFKDGKFVDSELGMIPEGWKVGCLGDMGNIVCGKTPSKANSNYYGGDIPFIKIPDMHGNIFVESSEDRLTELGSLSQIKKLIPPYSLMVSCIATVGLVSINTKPSHTNQQINTVIPHNKSALFYLYQYIKNNEELLKNMGRGGTTTLNVNTKSFSNIRLLIPSEIALEQFHRVVEGLFKKIELNLHESRTLSLLRDTLLPRLMSGELEVPE